jgi:2,4-diaminopentanoate dehydrogenase
MASAPTSVVLFGLGPIGRGVGQALASRGYRLVAGIDIDPELQKLDLAEAIGVTIDAGARVFGDAEKCFEDVQADVAVVSTTSRLGDVAPQILSCVRHGLNVVSTCEELASPPRDSAHVRELDRAARDVGRTVVSVGINPGFVMDVLPLVLSLVCLRVDHVRVVRVLDASRRRRPFQKKVGVGLAVDEFDAPDAPPRGHVGLEDSARLIAHYLGWELTRFSATLDPVLDDNGQVLGVRQTLVVDSNGREVIRLEFEAWAGVPNTRDEVEISGHPDLHVSVTGGIPGDEGTVAMVVNAIPRLLVASPGFMRPADLPLAAPWPTASMATVGAPDLARP